MIARKFKQTNVMIAEKQPQYETLPAHIHGINPEFPVTMSFKLNEEEIRQIIETGTIYITVLTFGKKLQAIVMTCLNPYLKK
jgi:hypothetical protein